jgi:large subunit ribosomal protein L24
MSLPVSLDDLRLVVQLNEFNAAQAAREVLIENIRGGPPFLERAYGSSTPRHTRYMTGDEGIEIPWPEEEFGDEEDKSWDSLRIEVETPTWLPSLLTPPFPSSVIDELRNKYGKTRTRHNPEYIEQKKLQDYREEYLKSRTMWTPPTEARQKRIAEKQSSGERLPDGNYKMGRKTEEFIERFMKQNSSQSP